MKVSKECAYCKKEMKIPKCREMRRMYCSKECLHKDKNTVIVCKFCKKEFEIYKSRIGEIAYCSLECKKNDIIERDPRIIKICIYCKKEFKVAKNRINTANYCSRKCIHDDTTTIKICEYCKKEFKIYNNREDTAKYCSKQCMNNNSRCYETCKFCNQQFEIINNQKGKRIYCSTECYNNDSIGNPYLSGPYYRCSDGNNQQLNYHRYLIQQHLGRKLLSNEHIHHIDGNKLNNTIDNLMIVSPSDHRKLHKEKEWKDIKCLHCGIIFSSCTEGCRPRKFCSDKCLRDHVIIIKEYICPQCKNIFISRKSQKRIYCSHKCSTTANNIKRKLANAKKREAKGVVK